MLVTALENRAAQLSVSAVMDREHCAHEISIAFDSFNKVKRQRKKERESREKMDVDCGILMEKVHCL